MSTLSCEIHSNRDVQFHPVVKVPNFSSFKITLKLLERGGQGGEQETFPGLDQSWLCTFWA